MASNSTPTYNRRRAKRAALRFLGTTEKRPTAGNNVSHSHRKTKRLFKPNLQKTKVMVGGKLVSVRLDARTIRTLTKDVKDRPERKPKAKPAAKKPATKTPAAKPAASKSK